ncbi:unnamed protein product, partial [marine sediment metagenome]
KTILNLKYYSQKDHLSDDNRIELNMFLEIILERILKENFILEGLAWKKPQKKIDFSQLINKIKVLLNSKWMKIIMLLIIAFIIIFFFKLIGIIGEISPILYIPCAILVFTIYWIFFNKK